MSAYVLGIGCQPFEMDFGADFGGVVRTDPEHSCSGGFTQPGLLGGWTCSCDCHRAAPKIAVGGGS